MIGSDRRLRVLVVSLGRRGGVTEYGWSMSQGLERHCDVAAVSSAGAENRQRWTALRGPHLEVPTFSTVPGMLVSFFRFPRFARIGRFARQFAPDVVYYPGGHAWKPLLDLVLPRQAVTVLTVHDPESHRGEDSLAHRALAAVNRLHVDGYVLLNRAQRPAFIARHRLAPARVTVIPHGVFDDLAEACAPLNQVAGLEQLADHAGSYALFVGRIQPYKGIDVLLEAYGGLGQTCDIPLVIAGAGRFSDRESELLREFSGSSVFVLNRWLSDAEMCSLVGSARFVVLPYTSASQSGAIPLASAVGVPAIASDAGGIAEQVVDNETGILFPAGDVPALTSALEDAFRMSDEAYAAMSGACRAYARENWAWDTLGERLVEFFTSIRAESRRERP